jgi:intracellular sulfur oxidation DsrE/DsrF family protein
VDTNRASGKTFEQVRDELKANLIPGAYIVGAQIAEIGRLQQKGYPVLFIPKQF